MNAVLRRVLSRRDGGGHPAGCHPGVRLDARAYRVSWQSDATVFEIDQPKVVEFKTATIEGLDARLGAGARAGADRPAAELAEGVAGGGF